MTLVLSGCLRYDDPLYPVDTNNTDDIEIPANITDAQIIDNGTEDAPVETLTLQNQTLTVNATNVTPRTVTGFRQGEMPPGQVFFFLGTGAGCMSDNDSEQSFGYMGDSYYRFISLKYPCTSGAYMRFTKITTDANAASFVKEWIMTNYPGSYVTVDGGDFERIVEARTDNTSARIVYQDSKSGSIIMILERVHAYPLGTPSEDVVDMDRLTKLYTDTYMVYSEAMDAKYYSSESFILEDGFYFGIGGSCSSKEFQEASLGLEGTNAVTFQMRQLFYTCDSDRQRVFSIVEPSSDDMVFSTKMYIYLPKDASLSIENIDGQNIIKETGSDNARWVWYDSENIYSWSVSGNLDETSQPEYDEVMMLLQNYIRNHPSAVSGTASDYKR